MNQAAVREPLRADRIAAPHSVSTRNGAPTPAKPSPVFESRNDEEESTDFYGRAGNLFNEGRYAEAADLLIQAFSAESACSVDRAAGKEPVVLLVRALANAGRLNDALEWCRSCVESDKLDPLFHYLHATILQETGSVQEAAEALKRVLYLDPYHVLAHFSLGNLSNANGKNDEARRHFENAFRLVNGLPKDHVIPQSDGITAGRLASYIEVMIR